MQCFRVVAGQAPASGGGEVQVLLTQDSADAVQRVGQVKRWTVGPTMTRGAKAAQKLARPKKAAAPKAKVFVKRTLLKKKQKIHPPLKLEEPAKKKPDLDNPEPSENMYRRTAAGRAVIQIQMQILFDLDAETFKSKPTFSADGKCRMAFQGASAFTKAMILEHSAQAMERMSLALCHCYCILLYCILSVAFVLIIFILHVIPIL